MKKILYQPIGIIHSPFETAKGSPIQSATAGEAEGRVEVFPEFFSILDPALFSDFFPVRQKDFFSFLPALPGSIQLYV